MLGFKLIHVSESGYWGPLMYADSTAGEPSINMITVDNK